MPKPAPAVPRHWSRRPDVRPTKHPRFRILTKTEYLDKKEFSIPAFDPDQPALFKKAFLDIPAIRKWFKKDAFLDASLTNKWNNKPNTFRYPQELNTAYLEQYGDAIVPLELTRSSPENALGNEAFERFEAPLALLLQHMSAADAQETSLYLAQHSLADLPAPLQEDLPTPLTFLSHLNARGDIYASSLWMGRPPTRTPLHRDPNPNLFVQLAGKKTIRMMKPGVGRMVFEAIRQHIRGPGGDAKMRGEEMMQGAEMEAMEMAVWNEDGDGSMGSATGWETTLRTGDALYIPNGWWHAVRGIGKGANASVGTANWWFR
ncbi:uncharacterized protein J4E92_007073 [Alternaria infectoria]|uniref:uncharacterized protein n=1 Tax=Alternaria infectoria TaxID=45303 RepID=UPI00221EDC2E|nr:uncharacterized protein J4E92_007073 [Alternaria infectoria]KAI4925035.1 hypothetical protein J4E92_007073 [Alternaria infectoria]